MEPIERSPVVSLPSAGEGELTLPFGETGQVQQRQHSVVDLVSVRLHDGTLSTAWQSRNRTTKQGEHSGIATQFLDLGAVEVSTWIQLCARRDQERDNLMVAGALCFGGRIAPSVESPHEGGRSVSFVFDIHRRVSFQKQFDDIPMSTIGGPVQPSLSVRLVVYCWMRSLACFLYCSKLERTGSRLRSAALMTNCLSWSCGNPPE